MPAIWIAQIKSCEAAQGLLELSQEKLSITLTLHRAEIGKAAEKGPLLCHNPSLPQTLLGVSACRRHLDAMWNPGRREPGDCFPNF